MKQEELDALYEDLQVDIKPGRGNYKYVKSRYILDRMNKTFMGNWSCDVITSERIDNEVLVQVRVSIMTEDGRVLRWQDGFGSAKYLNGLEYGNVYKSAKAKAVKDAVKSYGLGLFLEEEQDDGGSGNYSSTPSFSGPPSSPPKAPEKIDNSSSSFPGETSKVEDKIPAEKPPVENKDMGFVPPSFSSEGSKNVEFPPSFPGSDGSSEQKKNTPSGFPSMNTPENKSFDSPPEKKAPKLGEGGPTLTMVQKVAIAAKIAARKVSFKEFAVEVFEALGKDVSSIPNELDELSYVDAMAMASFK